MKACKMFLKCLYAVNNKFKYYDDSMHYPYRSYEAIKYVIKNEKFESVLDVGCGEGIHSDIFLKYGKKVTAIDYGESVYFKKNKHNPQICTIIGDINDYEFDKTFDLVWCSHVLEHQLNVNIFLKKLNKLCAEDGVLAVTVPPSKPYIVGGHVNVWNAGLLLYNLVLAGFDCREAHVKTYDYDISVVVRKRSISVLDELSYDAGDIRKIIKYLPAEISYTETQFDSIFNGNIEKINW